ncbi:hypothetical protein BU26DRAFT_521659 [Trematosphaeria pertusa]|uniref:Uncharacterized protein n=1 Tax=Trematosphaeria pertusa TaxID=390896 RepID=A0A6A6I6L3_9PLEO|nr:uncharacterized protein BU26DRAFT_521659 [Trematosphaeria pertusa]KAF2246194.1 hypothetical protein BU26DRAFT_521659 [Trematosphaeria pertusa]
MSDNWVHMKGPRPCALVLLTFTDIPVDHLPGPHRFYNFLTGRGQNALFDYWQQVSNHVITLDGSEVFGWYQMQYSFAKDSRRSWTTWRDEANRLCKDMNLADFRGGVIILVAASVDSYYWLNSGANTSGGFVMTTGGYWGNRKWRLCKKCGCLVRPDIEADPSIHGACLAGGIHELGDRYYAISDAPNDDLVGDSGWRRCEQCCVLFQTNNTNSTTQYICPALKPNLGPHTPWKFDCKVPTAQLGSSYQDGWKQCASCSQLTYTGISGVCTYNNGKHDVRFSANYGVVESTTSMKIALQAHNIGQALGLPLSWSANPDTAAGDPYDVMSAITTSRVKAFNLTEPLNFGWTTYCQDGFESTYSPAGPGLIAPTLWKMGWLSSAWPISAENLKARKNYSLRALGRPEQTGAGALYYVTRSRIYTVEFRQADGWDRGIGKDCVLVHELRSKYATGQKGFRYCRKCHGMFLASSAVCAAGDLHDARTNSTTYTLETSKGVELPDGAHIRSYWTCSSCHTIYNTDFPATFDMKYGCPCMPVASHYHSQGATEYIVPTDGPFIGSEKGWKRCRKCDALVYTLDRRNVGVCHHGGQHDCTGEAEGSIFIGVPTTPNVQYEVGFKRCYKCEILFDARLGSCKAGGSHDYTGSEAYNIPRKSEMAAGSPFKVCTKCLGVYIGGLAGTCPSGGQHSFDGREYTVHNSQDGTDCTGESWTHCTKCNLLLKNVSSSLACAAGGTHTCNAPVSWYLPHFKIDLAYLVGKPLYTGDAWQDPGNNFRIEVGAINSNHTVSVNVGEAMATSKTATPSL